MDILYINYVVYRDAVVAQSVARRLGKAEVTGSSPANSLKHFAEFLDKIRKFCIFILWQSTKRG